MKKFVIVLCSMMVLLMVGCFLNKEAATPGTRVMRGTIVEIDGEVMLVEPVEGSWELSSSDRFSIPVRHMETSPEPKTGDVVEVLYDGSVLETYPAALGQVISVRVVDQE